MNVVKGTRNGPSTTFFCCLSGLLLWEETFFNKLFCDLYCVCCGAFAEVVSNAPEVEAVLNRWVAADTSNEHVVLAPCIERHRIYVVCRIVLEGYARGVLQYLTDFFKGEVLFEFEVD